MAIRKREGFRERIRFSLVLRLNLHNMARMLSVLISVNLFLLMIFAGLAVIRIEDSAGRIAIAFQSESDRSVRDRLPDLFSKMTGYTVAVEPYGKAWKNVPASASAMDTWFDSFQLSGLRAMPEALREVTASDSSSVQTPVQWLDGLSYHLTYPLDTSGDIVDSVVSITASLWPSLLTSILALSLLTVLEFLLFLGSIPAGARSARRVLKPIDEMARVTRNINASRLDTRLSLRGSQNELKDLAGTINDMLERIHTAYRSQIRFVSDASHELRTPIAVVQGYANLLDRWGKNDPKTLQESISALKSESESMKELVEKLLFLARGDNNTLTLHMEPLFVDRLIRPLARETLMIDQNHVFRIAREEHVAVRADAQLLKQALRILIDNSIKYTPPGNEITISCSAVSANAIRISVQDSGIGIPAADVPFIFDRFYRADESRARKTGGTGLGLSIAKWIVERHDGQIEVLSRQGIGTRISIQLPRLTDAASLAQAEKGTDEAGSDNAQAGSAGAVSTVDWPISSVDWPEKP
ncbi:MAG TPA: ATP-binding protein [Clostridia bacterium]